MAAQDDERSCSCSCDCGCECNDTSVDKGFCTTHILGDTHNSVDLWVSTPTETKWIFVREEGNERTRTG